MLTNAIKYKNFDLNLFKQKTGPGLKLEVNQAYDDTDTFDVFVISKDLNPDHKNGTPSTNRDQMTVLTNLSKFGSEVDAIIEPDDQNLEFGESLFLGKETERAVAVSEVTQDELKALSQSDQVAFISGTNEIDEAYVSLLFPDEVKEAQEAGVFG